MIQRYDAVIHFSLSLRPWRSIGFFSKTVAYKIQTKQRLSSIQSKLSDAVLLVILRSQCITDSKAKTLWLKDFRIIIYFTGQHTKVIISNLFAVKH